MAGEELTADDGSIVLDGVFIVVHIGAAAQVEELLVAAVMGMAAPRGRQRSASPRDLIQFLMDQTFRLRSREGQLLA